MNAPDMSHWVLEKDAFDPDEETMPQAEMDALCHDLISSTQAYQRGEVPMRETLFTDGQPQTYWRFVDGLAADRYCVVIEWNRAQKVFVATMPELPGCRAEAETQADALQRVREAVTDWLDTAVREGRGIPVPGLLSKAA